MCPGGLLDGLVEEWGDGWVGVAGWPAWASEGQRSEVAWENCKIGL